MKTHDQAVFRIRTGSGSGTGFIVKAAPYVVTNYHVVAGYRRVSIGHGDVVVRGDVALVVPGKDLAFIRVDAASVFAGNAGLELREGSPANRDRVVAMGYPLGMPFSITEGIVSSEAQQLDGRTYIQTDTAVNPGNSGGPLIDDAGRVVGIITCKLPNAENMGYALPIAEAAAELLELSRNESTTYAVRCASCSARIEDRTEYCDGCGSEVPSAWFDEAPPSPVANFVEGAPSCCAASTPGPHAPGATLGCSIPAAPPSASSRTAIVL